MINQLSVKPEPNGSFIGFSARVALHRCFFMAASFEFDSRPGPVRSAIVKAMSAWLSTLTRAIEEAQAICHLKPDVKATQLALEIYSLAVGGHWASQLLGQRTALANARETIRARLDSVRLEQHAT